ncbi:MAG: hypothetical protein HYX47_12840 [Burkholderiales bacterium]|nr:hypothetical protein [Burkholderiales bacterium]
MTRFFIDLRVTDAEELFAAALRHATTVESMTQQQAEELLKPAGEIDEAACLVMLLDPGVSPSGTEIDESGVES